MVRLVFPVFCLTAMLCFASATYAEKPKFSFIPFKSIESPFKRVEADPKKNYQLTKDKGPWMIMAISLGGDERMENAQKIALELRRDHKLEAWVHEQEFDRGEQVIGLGVDERGNPKKMKNMRNKPAKEVAVFVGNFNSADDPAAQKVLEKVRTAKIKAFNEGATTGKERFGIRNSYFAAQEIVKAAKQGAQPQMRGALGRAFMTKNPLRPAEESAAVTLDPFVVELNQGVDYSLLENPAQYTVVVATFRGAAAYSDDQYVKSVTKVAEKSGDSPLDKAAKDAMLVAAVLRSKGVEAYVFHDRCESLVTVGAFDDIGTRMPDGHTELRPGIAKVIRDFEAKKKPVAGQVGLIPRTETVTNDNKTYAVPLDVSPRLIVVPRESIADIYREKR
jgi:hypothetical protein